MANGHGGARPGAGRRPRSEKFPEVFERLDERLADGVPDRMDALEYLAAGGFEQIEEIYEPAGLIYREDVTTGDDGKLQRTRVLAFPDLKPDALVCIRRTRSIAAPDRAANVYLLDRFAGKPVQATELSGPDGAPIPIDLTSALDRVYGPENEDGE
jgi:hypothetical protein